MKKTLGLIISSIIIALILLLISLGINHFRPTVTPIITPAKPCVKQIDEKITVILDAGHGGIDSGAVGVSGVYEKDLNLWYAKTLRDMLILDGYKVIMTREDDKMLEYNGKTGKSADLRARLELCEKTDNCILVSVHMNKFSSSSVRGASVYYSPNHKDGRVLAETVMSFFSEYIPECGKRPIKASDSAIYILNRITKPAILVEFGFISNSEEERLLADPIYRSRMCAAIRSAVREYSENINHN